MAANSRHYGDIYRWIESIIDSCTQPMHENAVRKLITQFRDNLKESGEVDKDTAYMMEDTLRYRLDTRVYARWDKVLIKG